MKRDPSSIEIRVRPSIRGKQHPLTAYIAGTQLEGQGRTVLAAIEDLFTTRGTAKICEALEQKVAESDWIPDA